MSDGIGKNTEDIGMAEAIGLKLDDLVLKVTETGNAIVHELAVDFGGEEDFVGQGTHDRHASGKTLLNKLDDLARKADGIGRELAISFGGMDRHGRSFGGRTFVGRLEAIEGHMESMAQSMRGIDRNLGRIDRNLGRMADLVVEEVLDERKREAEKKQGREG